MATESSISLPVLGPEGFITKPSDMLRQAFQVIFVSDYSQSNIFFGNVTSVQYVLSLFPNDMEKTISLLETGIQKYLLRFFSNVEVNITDVTIGDGAKRTLSVDIVVTDATGTKHSLGATIRDSNNPQSSLVIDALSGE